MTHPFNRWCMYEAHEGWGEGVYTSVSLLKDALVYMVWGGQRRRLGTALCLPSVKVLIRQISTWTGGTREITYITMDSLPTRTARRTTQQCPFVSPLYTTETPPRHLECNSPEVLARYEIGRKWPHYHTETLLKMDFTFHLYSTHRWQRVHPDSENRLQMGSVGHREGELTALWGHLPTSERVGLGSAQAHNSSSLLTQLGDSRLGFKWLASRHPWGTQTEFPAPGLGPSQLHPYFRHLGREWMGTLVLR